MAGHTIAEDGSAVGRHLLHMNHLHRLHLLRVERMRLVLHFREIDIHKIYAAYVAVPCCPVVELHGREICGSSELGRTREILRNLIHRVLAADRDIEIVQDMEGLDYSLEACGPHWGCGLEEGRADES